MYWEVVIIRIFGGSILCRGRVVMQDTIYLMSPMDKIYWPKNEGGRGGGGALHKETTSLFVKRWFLSEVSTNDLTREIGD